MEAILGRYSKEQIEKARKVKMIICDVDGVLTNGGIIYDNTGNELKIFHVGDGQIMKMLRQSEINIGAITGRSSEVVRLRMEEMGMDFHYHGIKDKRQKYQEIKEEWSLQDEEIAYLGDDVIDIPVLKLCGFAVTPHDAKPYVKAYASLVTEAKGGEGVFREVADLILAARGEFEKALWRYLENNQEKS